MQAPNIRHQLNLHWHKIVVVLLLTVTFQGYSQDNHATEHLIDYDDQIVHYGFLMGLHQSKYRIRYNELFTSPLMDSLHSIVPNQTGGFKLGFVVDFHVLQYLSIRLLPTVAFYENSMTYRFTDGSALKELKDATMMEMPLLFKYKSVRRRNSAMYLVGGINPSLEAAARNEESTRQKLELRRFNLAIDIGAGFDIYYPLFKFSPEIRYSFGVRDMQRPSKNDFNANLEDLMMHNIGVFITFEGGPTYLKRRKRK